MKSFQTSLRSVFVEDLAQQLNAHITKSHQNILQTCVLFEARSYANKKLPTANEPTLDPYLTSLIGLYRALRKDISIKMQGSLLRFLGITSITPLEEKIKGVGDAILKETDKIRNLEADKSRIQQGCKHTGYTMAWVLLACIAVAECLFTVSGFLKLGDIFIIALIVGCMVGVAQVAAAKHAVLTIREIEPLKKQKKYWIIALISFSIESICLGTLRYYLAHAGIASTISLIGLSPFTFAIINMLFIVASGLIVYFYYPTKAELEQLSHIEDIKKDIEKSTKLKGTLIKQYDALVADKVKAIRVHGQLIHCEKELLEKIDSFYDQAVGIFKHENTMKRNDGVFPECFKRPHSLLPISINKEFTSLPNL